MLQSKELTEFYLSYAAWLDDGATHGEPFNHNYGLCASLNFFCEEVGYSARKLRGELEQQFIDAGLSSAYPFNQTGDSYTMERNSKRIHENTKRIQWVREHCKA